MKISAIGFKQAISATQNQENKSETSSQGNAKEKNKKLALTLLGLAAVGTAGILIGRASKTQKITKEITENLPKNEIVKTEEELIKDIYWKELSANPGEKVTLTEEEEKYLNKLNNVTKDENTAAYKAKTAKECIEKLFGKIPEEQKTLEKYLKTPYRTGISIQKELPLDIAVEYGDNELVEKFITHGADINHNIYSSMPIHKAVINGHTHTAKLLTQKGANINSLTDRYTVLGANVIDLAARKGNNDLIEFFMNKGVKLLEADGKRDTALMLAAENGHAHTLDFLIKKGADVNATDSLLYTPIHYAAKHGNKESVQILINNKANVNAKSDIAITPLMEALQNENYEAADVLLENGSDINTVWATGENAVHYAANLLGPKQPEKLLNYLKEKGANFNQLNIVEETPLDIAIEYKKDKEAEIIKQFGGKLAEDILPAVIRPGKDNGEKLLKIKGQEPIKLYLSKKSKNADILYVSSNKSEEILSVIEHIDKIQGKDFFPQIKAIEFKQPQETTNTNFINDYYDKNYNQDSRPMIGSRQYPIIKIEEAKTLFEKSKNNQ